MTLPANCPLLTESRSTSRRRALGCGGRVVSMAFSIVAIVALACVFLAGWEMLPW